MVAVNNFDVNGRTKLEVARMIQNAGVRPILATQKPIQVFAQKYAPRKLWKKSSKRIVDINNFYAVFRAKIICAARKLRNNSSKRIWWLSTTLTSRQKLGTF